MLLLATALCATLAACTPRYTAVQSGSTQEFGVVRLGGSMAYVIDPRTETCLLISQTMEQSFAVVVPCAKLKANVPAAGRFITWDTSSDR